ncbi:MAG: ABC transporter permease [Lachnospiraceae bacterium]|uniref:ABC transporter permease n=1 Tax=Parablautia sp. Marseille-Q6255 TaxID=3039593 RepID=UPI0024BCE4BB|nr:ABC transporter permease [Parablautia sp. Marseille-Q6255]
MKENPNPLSFQARINPDDFLPASAQEKESLVVMRESVSFWKDGLRRLLKNKVAMVSLVVVVIIMIFAFIVPSFYPYTYKEQIRGSENLAPMQYSEEELERMDAGEKVFPHVMGTDKLGRDYAIRVMMGARISLVVGLVAAVIIFIIGSAFGSIAAFFGGWVDIFMMRLVDIMYTIPDILLIVLLSFALKDPLEKLSMTPGFGWIQVLGANLISIFIVFALLYWGGMARMVRSQILTLKESEYVTAARALGASNVRIIKKHLLTNCIGTLIVTTTLQIPSSIFTESFLSFLGLGVAVPMPSLGSLAGEAINGLNTYPYLLFIPAVTISLIILSFNLLGDGLRDAFDPKMKN